MHNHSTCAQNKALIELRGMCMDSQRARAQRWRGANLVVHEHVDTAFSRVLKGIGNLQQPTNVSGVLPSWNCDVMRLPSAYLVVEKRDGRGELALGPPDDHVIAVDLFNAQMSRVWDTEGKDARIAVKVPHQQLGRAQFSPILGHCLLQPVDHGVGLGRNASQLARHDTVTITCAVHRKAETPQAIPSLQHT